MEIKSLNNLKKDSSGMYDLYAEVINGKNIISIFKFPLTDKHDMRIDLVCNDIYGNTDSVDLLCVLNGIIQPLTIQSGDVLFFVDKDDLTNIRSNAAARDAIVQAVVNANKGKSQKTDTNRTADTANRKDKEKAKQFIPPNLIQATSNIDYGEGIIILRPNF